MDREVSGELQTEALEAKQGWAPEFGITSPLPMGQKLKGTSTLVDKRTGEQVLQWVKTNEDAEAQQAVLEAAARAMVSDMPRLAPRKASGTWRQDLLTVYPIGDPHIGMYAWAEETGDDWDLNIAERVHCGAMAELVQAAPATEQAIVWNLGDALHYDSMAAVTPRSGHFLDADGRYAKMVSVAVKIIRQCIESALTKHARVHVVNLPGNHDETGALWLSIALSHIYENEPRVTVDTNPSVFSYYRWGKVLLGGHHGHACKPAALAGVMACDRAKDWGETSHRHWLIGHIHHESKKEFSGVTVESFNTLAAKDAYATNGGWRSGRSMQAIVYHAEHGEVGRSKVCAAMFE
ncbi:oxidoreductase [Pseudoxanthomonas sacheonensis]|nr:oxidoreductase [Pseudoxanthomonas sacheonensis]